MKKWLISIVLFLTILVSPFISTIQAKAFTSVNITITATGFIVAAPVGFTVYYISDYEVGILWTKPVGAANTMIRAKYGSVPTSITDGYLVYSGAAEAASDTAVSLDETAAMIYYRAWCQSAGGVWGNLYAEGTMEGIGMTLIAFVLLALGLMIATFALKSGRRILAFATAGAWMVLGAYCYTKYVTLWDVYYALFWLSAGMVIVCALIPVILRERKEDVAEEDYGDDRELIEDIKAGEADEARMDRIFGKRRKPKKRIIY